MEEEVKQKSRTKVQYLQTCWSDGFTRSKLIGSGSTVFIKEGLEGITRVQSEGQL